MKRISCFFSINILFAVFLLQTISCSKSADSAVYDMGAVQETAVISTKAMKAAPRMMADSIAAEEVQTNSTASGATLSEGLERKLIKTGSIRLEVDNLSSTEEAVNAWCASFDGYISSSYSEENRASFVVRVPAADFDAAMTAVGNLGTVKSRSISTQDVSEQFYDLQTRLETRKILRDRLQSYLASAKDMKDMLQIESELNNTLSEIESMEGRMRRLSGQIDYSTITLDVELPYRTTDQGFQWPEFSTGFRRFASNIVDFFAGLLGVLLYALICGIPVLAILAFLYWLLLGKVGLLKRIFKRLSGQKKE